MGTADFARTHPQGVDGIEVVRAVAWRTVPVAPRFAEIPKAVFIVLGASEGRGVGLRARHLDLAQIVQRNGGKHQTAWAPRRADAGTALLGGMMKRNAGPLLRVTLAEGTDARGVNPAARATGPTTFADRRAQMEVATRALGLLPARDRALVEAISSGLSVEETAERLGISSAAAQRARLRAKERFRSTFALAMRRRGPT